MAERFDHIPRPEELVVGLKLRLTAKELRDHCALRAAYHLDRAAEKKKQKPDLKAALDKIAETKPSVNVSQLGGKSVYALDPADPINDLDTDIRDHENKALVFTFFAAHFFDNDHILDESDLVRLEFLKR